MLPVVVSVWVMEEPLAALAPLVPLWVTVQEKVVPAVPEESAIELAFPEQMVWVLGVAVIEGDGLTVTVMERGVPVQPFAEGVTE